jgi:hypothetical protein
MKSREDIINSMCITSRHDYGLDRSPDETVGYPFSSGMTEVERAALRADMEQLFDNCIAPYMEFKA